MTRTLLVTGITGFVGRALREPLRASGEWNVRVLTRRALPETDPVAFEPVVSGLDDSTGLERACRGVDVVLHMASPTGKVSRRLARRDIVEATERLLVAARSANVGHFVYVSSIAAKFRNQRFYPYARAKRTAEELVAASGVPFTIVRPTMVFGRGAPLFAGLRTLTRLPLVPVFGSGETPVQPIGVDDLAKTLLELCALDPLGTTLELGGKDALTIEDLLAWIKRLDTRKGGRMLHLPAWPFSGMLGVLEPLLRPLLPLTAGQIRTFTEAGTAADHPVLAARRARFQSLKRVLEGCAAT